MTVLSQRLPFHATTAKDEAVAVCEERVGALVARHAKFVFRVAYSVLRNSHDAEDVVQETFLKLCRLRNWKKIENEKAFLARMTWRIAVERLPKIFNAQDETKMHAPGQSPEEAMIAADWNEAVWRLIDALPEELRRPLALSTVEELNSHEIAQILGMPDGTVRHRLMRARQLLKQKLSALMENRRGR